MIVEPYKSFGPLNFGESTREDCMAQFGTPKQIRKNREGAEEYHYDEFIIRFDSVTNTVRECTLLPWAKASIAGFDITWDRAFIKNAYNFDQSPQNVYGFIVFNRLGIAVTGIHDHDDSQLAITAFSKGDFDELLADAVPYEIS